ncbi:uracil-DNA glycosylase [Cohaesibacter sp. CAU 1516]|uniref:uracil-DNA glycosylase n=1 Tax=Cohaesibacter sp. CAU 1516 TaxID=2576038 RepID=UPI0010FEF07F|nr:uracil-DNA glycosylase [Cohaesibacter sp. CAU 1516]TLP45554.1 uracil-DNA glycosylase [Cohaesibacter sp. CAU 1516]
MLNTVTSAHDLAALIEWYGAMGADCALDDLPQDRFEESQRQARERASARTAKAAAFDNRANASPSQPVGSTLTSKSSSNQSRPSLNAPQHGQQEGQAPAFLNPGSASVVEDARQMAAQAQTLADLRQALATFEGCSLKLSAKSLVFGDGNPDGEVMFIGEAPGRDEDLQGIPFVGRAGQLLDKMMTAIKLDRSNSYITNILPWRPPGNRKPSIDEQAMLQPFIHRHIELVNPKLLVFLGGTAAQQLLDSKEGIMRLRGRWRTYAVSGREIPAMSTLHPAFLLRTPAQKRAAWQDLLEVAAKLDSLR